MKKVVKKNQVILTLLAMMIAVAGYLNYAGKGQQASGAGDKDSTSVNAGASDDGSLDDILAENGAAGETLVDVEAFPEDGDDQSGQVSGDGDAVIGENQNGGQSGEVSGGGDAVIDGSQSSDQVSGNVNGSGAGDGQGENSTINLPSSTPGEAILTNGVTVADYVATVQLNREQVRARNKETLLDVINNDNISEELKASAVSMIVKMTETAEMENSVETLLSAKGFESSVVSISDSMVDVVVSRYTLTDAERAQIEDIVERKTGMSIEHIVITLMELAEE